MTEAVLIFAPPQAMARAGQAARLYQGLGLGVDLVQVAAAGPPAADWPGVRGRGRIAPGALADRAALAGMLADLADPGQLVALHAIGGAQIGALAAAPRGVLRVFDQGPDGVPDQIAPRPDLMLAMDEPARRILARAMNGPALRLPPPMPDPDLQVPIPRPRLGWIGTWDAALLQAWQGLFDDLVGAAARLPGGMLFGGPGAGQLRPPPALGTALIVTDPARLPGALRALGLAVLPLDDATGRGGDIARLLAARVPILTLSVAAAGFEDRWAMPGAADRAAMARQIAALGPILAAGGPPPEWAAQGARTAAAWTRDHAAMTAHVAGIVAEALAAI